MNEQELLIKETFSSYDTDGDQRITVNQLASAFKDLGIEATDEEVEQYGKELSKGKKGFIHKVDFINKVQSLMPE